MKNTAEFLSCSDAERPRGAPSSSSIRTIKIKTASDETKYLPDLKVIEGTMPNYTKIPEKYTKDTTPAEITFNNVDTINLISQVLTSLSSEDLFLEEVQYSFISYLCGLSIDSLTHWRKILSLFCNSLQAVAKYQNFYRKFVKVIKHQIVHIPVEFIMQSLENSIYVDVKNLLVNLLSNNLVPSAHDLILHLKNEIAWNFDNLMEEEDPEFLPTVVELTESERNLIEGANCN